MCCSYNLYQSHGQVRPIVIVAGVDCCVMGYPFHAVTSGLYGVICVFVEGDVCKEVDVWSFIVFIIVYVKCCILRLFVKCRYEAGEIRLLIVV